MQQLPFGKIPAIVHGFCIVVLRELSGRVLLIIRIGRLYFLWGRLLSDCFQLIELFGLSDRILFSVHRSDVVGALHSLPRRIILCGSGTVCGLWLVRSWPLLGGLVHGLFTMRCWFFFCCEWLVDLHELPDRFVPEYSRVYEYLSDLQRGLLSAKSWAGVMRWLFSGVLPC